MIGAGLSDGLDWQAKGAGGRAVATNAGEPSVDDVADARHSQRGLGNVGREDDAAATLWVKDALLIGVGHTAVERKDVTTAGAAVFEFAAQFVNVALAGQEDEDVAFVVVIDDLVN